MAVYFFDSSAIVKRYLNEVGTAWVSRLTDVATGNKVYLAHITFVEVISAITRKARMPGLTATVAAKAIADFRSDFIYEYAPVQMTAAISDVSLNAAAVAEGLAVNDPNQHP